jgi:Uma2 family endonuclease
MRSTRRVKTLTALPDDGIVVVVQEYRIRRRPGEWQPSMPLTTAEYLALPEQLSPQELVWGVVREPPAPLYGHQSVVGNIFRELSQHVIANRLGMVGVSPLDVILDQERGLVVQPDVLFVAQPRLGIIRGQVWGPPDLVVEVASRRTASRDRTTKLGWYRTYGVRECWLVSPARQTVRVFDLEQQRRKASVRFTGNQRIRSAVLPKLNLEAVWCFR